MVSGSASPDDQVYPVANPELAENVTHMRLDGDFRDQQAPGNLGVGAARDDEFKYGPFAIGEHLQRVRVRRRLRLAGGEPIEQALAGTRGGNERTMVGGADRVDESQALYCERTTRRWARRGSVKRYLIGVPAPLAEDTRFELVRA